MGNTYREGKHVSRRKQFNQLLNLEQNQLGKHMIVTNPFNKLTEFLSLNSVEVLNSKIQPKTYVLLNIDTCKEKDTIIYGKKHKRSISLIFMKVFTLVYYISLIFKMVLQHLRFKKNIWFNYQMLVHIYHLRWVVQHYD